MKRFLAARLVSIIFIINIFLVFPVYAEGNNADIFEDRVNIQINGKNTDMTNLLYQNKTYVPLRDFTERLGLNIGWDFETNSVNMHVPENLDSSLKKGIFNTIIFLISKALQISGLVILGQIVFARSRKDFYFIKKFNSSNTGLKRLLLTNALTRIGLYFMTAGTALSFFYQNADALPWVKFILLPVSAACFWFLGLMSANIISKKDISELAMNNPQNYQKF